MFFSTYVLTKKGPLAKIWLAAHWDKKLTKNEVRVIDLNQSVVQIVDPVVPIALRTSGELMVGVVRIYSLKVRHLLKDATDATMLLLRPKNVQLVRGKEKENAAAVTMDIVVARAAGTDIAEADFGGIADILAGGKGAAAAKPAAGEEVIGTAWFTTESSQLVEEGALGASQDEIAKIRADLLNNANRAESSTTGTSKTSMSSLEKGRASGQAHAVAGAGADDFLDIGAPPPADMEFVLPAIDGSGLAGGVDLADPFAAVPGVEFSQPKDGSKIGAGGADEDALPAKMARKLPKLLDSTDTVMTKDQFKKMVNDTHDIVNAERRHGPLDEEETRDRQTIRSGDANITDCQPLADVIAPGLKAVYEAALRTSVAKAVERMEAARGSTADRASGRATEYVTDDGLVAQPPMEGDVPGIDALGEYPAQALPEEEGSEEASRAGKRKREQRDGFSASAIATLEKVRGVLKGRTEKMQFNNMNGKDAPMKRQAAARTFVDVLALASHGFVEVEQSRPFADIALLKTKKLNEPIVARN